MIAFMLRRLGYMLVTLVLISILTFAIIQLPPGDYLSSMVAGMTAEGVQVNQAFIEGMRERYGLDEPFYVQYWKWISNIVLHGDFGQSFEWNRPVSTLIYERMGLTLVLSISTLLFIWAVAFPIGIYSAIRQQLGRRVPRDLRRVHRPRDPELPDRAGLHVRLVPLHGAVGRRPVLARVRERRLEPRQGRRPHQPSVDPGHRPRARPAPRA